MFSKQCNYGIRVSIYLYNHKERNFISLKKIATELRIPFHFLTKVMQKLNNAGIIESKKGPVGGIKLRDGKIISIYDIVTGINGKDEILHKCFLGLKECNLKKPCPFHNQWQKFTESINKNLKDLDLNSFQKNNFI